MKILIVGAGIAGLSMALAFEKIGLLPRIIEKFPRSNLQGCGIALPMNAVACLDYFGLYEELIKNGKVIENITYSLPDETVLSTRSLSVSPLNKYPFVGLSRTRLMNLLLRAIKSKIEYQKYIVDIQFNDNSNSANVTFNDTEFSEFDLVIAADGINSDLRSKTLKIESKIDLGISNWRFIANLRQNNPIYYIGMKSVFMIYPISQTQVYCYAHVASNSSNIPNRSDIYNSFREYSNFIRSVINSIEKDDIICGRLYSIPKPVFNYKNLIFIGDASHACSPMLQQGASLAFEDSITLARSIKESINIDKALEHYIAIRLPRLKWVRDNSDAPLKYLSSFDNAYEYNKNTLYIKNNGPINVAKWKTLFSQDYFKYLDNYF